MSTKNMADEEIARRDGRTVIRERRRVAKITDRVVRAFQAHMGVRRVRSWVGTRPETVRDREDRAREAEAALEAEVLRALQERKRAKRAPRASKKKALKRVRKQ